MNNEDEFKVIEVDNMKKVIVYLQLIINRNYHGKLRRNFKNIFSKYDEIIVITNSLGAYFSFISLSEKAYVRNNPIKWNIPSSIL